MWLHCALVSDDLPRRDPFYRLSLIVAAICRHIIHILLLTRRLLTFHQAPVALPRRYGGSAPCFNDGFNAVSLSGLRMHWWTLLEAQLR